MLALKSAVVDHFRTLSMSTKSKCDSSFNGCWQSNVRHFISITIFSPGILDIVGALNGCWRSTYRLIVGITNHLLHRVLRHRRRAVLRQPTIINIHHIFRFGYSREITTFKCMFQSQITSTTSFKTSLNGQDQLKSPFPEFSNIIATMTVPSIKQKTAFFFESVGLTPKNLIVRGNDTWLKLYETKLTLTYISRLGYSFFTTRSVGGRKCMYSSFWPIQNRYLSSAIIENVRSDLNNV